MEVTVSREGVGDCKGWEFARGGGVPSGDQLHVLLKIGLLDEAKGVVTNLSIKAELLDRSSSRGHGTIIGAGAQGRDSPAF